MDLERAFVFIWQDKDWPTKILIAAALTITGIGVIGLIGWVAELSRRVTAGEEDTLPEWDRIGEYFLTGIKLMGVSLIWSLPVILLVIFFTLVPAGVALTMSDNNQGLAIGMISIFSTCFFVFFFFYMLAISLLWPTLYTAAAEETAFQELLNPKFAWETLKANAGGFLIALLISWLVSSVLGSLGAILCLVGTFPATVISQLIMSHLIGQATAQARETLKTAEAV